MIVRRFPAAVLLGLLLTGTGLAQDIPDTKAYEDVLNTMLATLGEMTAALKKVDNVNAINQGRDELKLAVSKFLDVRKEAEQIKLPDKKQRDLIVQKYQEKLAREMDALRAEVGRVSRNPELKGVLEELARLNPQSPKKTESEKQSNP
jgi:glycyl-tRNA synthetase beta subunit